MHGDATKLNSKMNEALAFSRGSEEKTKKAVEVAGRLKSAVLAAEAARADYLNVLSDARSVMTKLDAASTA